MAELLKYQIRLASLSLGFFSSPSPHPPLSHQVPTFGFDEEEIIQWSHGCSMITRWMLDSVAWQELVALGGEKREEEEEEEGEREGERETARRRTPFVFCAGKGGYGGVCFGNR